MVQGETKTRPPRRRPLKSLDRLRQHPTGRLVLKVTIAVLGALVVGVGTLLIPLPGPGWLIVFAGIGIWAVEFHWARRLLAWGRRWSRRWTFWVTTKAWPVRMLIGLLGLIFISGVIAGSLRLTLGIDVVSPLLNQLSEN
jgi:uncharacterized protein (TIGR02611 family)